MLKESGDPIQGYLTYKARWFIARTKHVMLLGPTQSSRAQRYIYLASDIHPFSNFRESVHAKGSNWGQTPWSKAPKFYPTRTLE